MAVKERTWENRDGTQSKRWVVDYRDRSGKRRLETFKLKRDARARWHVIEQQKQAGTHVPRSQSITVEEAAANYLAYPKTRKLEASTVAQYEQHCRLHIVPVIGRVKLADLTAADIFEWQTELANNGRSDAMVRKCRVTLGSILGHAVATRKINHNVARDVAREKSSNRPPPRLEVGKDIPTIEEVRALLNAVKGRFRPLFITAVCSGLRASELRGLRWSDVDFDKAQVSVRQRADRFLQLGPPKSKAGQREVPVIPMCINVLREWKLACPPSELDLVFPTNEGGVQDYNNIRKKQLDPLLRRAGILDEGGAPKYSFHSFRHFFCSWMINDTESGGQGLSAKIAQERMGHASVMMTLDVYGHLFPRRDDSEQLAKAERGLLGDATA